MPLDDALRWVAIGLALALIQRGAEHLDDEPWLFAPQIGLAVALLLGFWPEVMLTGLWALGLAQLQHFRGPYNGGSDKMVLLALTCLTAAAWFPGLADLALGYLAVQVVLSYVVSGWVKLRNPDWRSGAALRDVFAFSAYPTSTDLRALAHRPDLIRPASWAVIGFELAFPLALWSGPVLLLAALVCAAAFHVANAVLFGLNRFVWAWVATYPSLIWFQERLFGG